MSGDKKWDNVISSRDNLISFLIKCGSQREAGRRLNKDHKAIKYWMDKYEINVEDYKEKDNENMGKKEEEKDNIKELYESDEYSYDENEDTYIIYLKDKSIEIHKDDLKLFKDLYCGPEKMTLAQCSREMGIPRKLLNSVRKAFKITHDDIPFLKDEIYKKSIEEMVDEVLAKKEDLFYRKLQQKDYEHTQRELKKYKKRDYFLEKAISKVVSNIDKLEYQAPELYEVGLEEHEEKVLVINITDWHKGKMVEAESLLGDGGYDKFKFQEMVKKYTKEAITLIEMTNPEKVYILNYGDGIDGPNAQVYDNQVLSQDIHGEDQILEYINDLKNFILNIYNYQPNIYYSSVPGNHSKGISNSDALANKVLAEMLSDYDSIEFDVDKKEYKIIDIYDSRVIQCHGHHIRNGKNTGENDVLNMINMEHLPYKRTYIVHGHLHHERVEGTNYKRILLPSPVGGDLLSNNIMNTTARPSQIMFVMKKGDGIKSENHVYFD